MPVSQWLSISCIVLYIVWNATDNPLRIWYGSCLVELRALSLKRLGICRCFVSGSHWTLLFSNHFHALRKGPFQPHIVSPLCCQSARRAAGLRQMSLLSSDGAGVWMRMCVCLHTYNSPVPDHRELSSCWGLPVTVLPHSCPLTQHLLFPLPGESLLRQTQSSWWRS